MRPAVWVGVGAALGVAASALLRQRLPTAAPTREHQGETVVSVVTPVVTPRHAECVLAALEPLPSDRPLALLIDTYGGELHACVTLSKELRRFTRSRAVVPVRGLSGGTLLSLSTRSLFLGRGAVLSAVDPLVNGERARHRAASDPSPMYRQWALEYHEAVSAHLRDLLTGRVSDLDAACALLLGQRQPHAWPLGRKELAGVGVRAELALPAFRSLVPLLSF